VRSGARVTVVRRLDVDGLADRADDRECVVLARKFGQRDYMYTKYEKNSKRRDSTLTRRTNGRKKK